MANFIDRRQCPVSVTSPEECNERLDAIATWFEQDWLETSGDHPLQILWKRQDGLSTVELLNFGDALLKLASDDQAWLRKQVSIVKSGSIGNRNGAIFEIFALSTFIRKKCRMVPASGSNPGYDGSLRFDDGSTAVLSLKNHGKSNHEIDFEKRAADLEAHFRMLADRKTGLELRIVSPRHFSSAADWQNLQKDVEHVIANAGPNDVPGTPKSGCALVLKQVSPEYLPLGRHNLSASFFLAMPCHQNEQNNFADAVRRGIDNLGRQTAKLGSDVCRVVMLRLSASASVSKCVDYAKWYFQQYPQDPVDMIILYQTAVITDVLVDQSAVSHYIIPVSGPRYAAWSVAKHGQTRRLPGFSIFVGTILSSPSYNAIVSDGKIQADLSGYYTYQKADIYRLIETRDTPEAFFQLANPAPGVMIHAELHQGGQYQMTMHMKAPNRFDLLLLP